MSKRNYVVCDSGGIPLAGQSYYTLQEAVDRYNREVMELVRLFDGKPKDYTRCFAILDMKTFKYVL